MLRFLRYTLLALILLVVALVSALTAMRMAIHGREVRVPKMVGLTPEDARKLALENGLLVQVENRYYSSEVPMGRILSQNPEAGAMVRRGWRVRLAQSMGPQHVAIPNVLGQSLRAAEINLLRRGLELGDVSTIHWPGRPPNQVIAQFPMPETIGIASPRIDLLVNGPRPEPPPYVMPDLVGTPFARALPMLERAGLQVRRVRPEPLVPAQQAPQRLLPSRRPPELPCPRNLFRLAASLNHRRQAPHPLPVPASFSRRSPHLEARSWPAAWSSCTYDSPESLPSPVHSFSPRDYFCRSRMAAKNPSQGCTPGIVRRNGPSTSEATSAHASSPFFSSSSSSSWQ
jgi:hypothetical protein